MVTNYIKTMLVQMKLTDEAYSVVVANDGQGIISMDYFPQLNEKYVEGLCWVIFRPGGTTWGAANTGVAVSEISEANLQVMVYYIKMFKMIRRTCKHANVELSKVRALYHQREI